MNIVEMLVFAAYFVFMLGIGLYFFVKSKGAGEKDYFLGGRNMGAWVSALSAGASDMSAWVLMGLPASIYAFGIGQTWIAIGLGIGYALSWIFVAPRLRRFSIAAKDSITIPQYLTNRFLSGSKVLQVLCASIFLVAYTIYAASSIKACGTLFNTVMNIDATVAMYLAAFIIIAYTFLGGLSAVCWTDFFQGLLILGAMLIAPLFAAFMLPPASQAITDENYWNACANWKQIVSGLAWGLGYFGMPHIIIRFMSIKSQAELKRSAKIGISWTVLIVIFAAVIGVIGRIKLGLDDNIRANELVFVEMVRMIFPGVISGILLSAVLAASMSTADSQLLAASSAFASDVYKPLVSRNQASDRELLWIGRMVVLVVAMAALLLATNPKAGSIMGLVSNAWGVFGAAFGPAILLSLFWRRFSIAGAIAGILIGAGVDILWIICAPISGIYELLPGFVAGFVGAIAVTLATKAPSQEVCELFDRAAKYED